MHVIPVHSYNVLLIVEDPKETEVYSDLIREVADCKVDVMTRVENQVGWIARSNYHLVVVESPEVGGEGGGGRPGGLAVLEQIRRFSPVTAVILISERASVEEAVAAIRLGAEDYLKKPFSLEAFKLAVKRGLDRKEIFGGENSGVSSFLNLLNSCQMISASLEEDRIFRIVRSHLSRELKSDHSAIYTLRAREDGTPEVARVAEPRGEAPQDRAMEEILDIALQASNPLPGMAATGEFHRFVERGQLTPGLFVFRFRCAGEADHFCVCLSPERPAALEAFESRLRMLKAQIEVTGRNIEQYMGVQHLAYVDDATGLYNTRYLHTILDREIAQANATQKSFAVLFADADRFKQVNDRYGHLVGTRLLNELGHQLKKLVRDSDTVFRYGGDEFVAVLSSCDLPTARTVAERIRQSVEQHSFLCSEGLDLHFTVSVGVALFPDHARSKRAIIDAADQAMYSSKRRSRNSVTIAGEAPPASPETASASTAAPEPVPAPPAPLRREKGKRNG
ncbi:MAG: diguanylate cyclase [Oligoflexia bacterium]|nr:diguanylate cyclase [Oligoflexia bacterium]